MQYRVTYRSDLDLEPELIEADEVAVEGDSSIVLRRTVMVIGSPRTVGARRLRAADVQAVDEGGARDLGAHRE